MDITERYFDGIGKILLTYGISSDFLFLQELLKAHYLHLKFSHYQARNHAVGRRPNSTKCFILGQFKHQRS